MRTKGDSWTIIGLFVLVIALLALVAELSVELDKKTRTQATGDYIATPSGNTKVYKFVDADGSKCYIAESRWDNNIALECAIAEDAK